MEYYLPSEVARLVLGYLKEEDCMGSYQLFLKECPHLKEYALLLERGRQFPTCIGGKTLKQILDDYGHSSNLVGKQGSAEALWIQFEALSQQLKKVYNAPSVTKSTRRCQVLAQESSKKTPSATGTPTAFQPLQAKQVILTPISLQNVSGQIRLVHARPLVPPGGISCPVSSVATTPVCVRPSGSGSVVNTPLPYAGRPLPEGISFVTEQPQASTEAVSLPNDKSPVGKPKSRSRSRTRSAPKTIQQEEQIVQASLLPVTSCGVQSIITTSSTALTTQASVASDTRTNVTSSYTYSHSSVMSPALVSHSPSPVQSCIGLKKPRKITGTLIEPIDPKKTSTPCKSSESASSDVGKPHFDNTVGSDALPHLQLDLSKDQGTPLAGHGASCKLKEAENSEVCHDTTDDHDGMDFDNHCGDDYSYDRTLVDSIPCANEPVPSTSSYNPLDLNVQLLDDETDTGKPVPVPTILNTPVKNPSLSGSMDKSVIGKSPRRKSQAPKRHSRDTSTLPVSLKLHSESSNSNEGTLADGELPPVVLKELLKNEKLAKRLAENINRYKLVSEDRSGCAEMKIAGKMAGDVHTKVKLVPQSEPQVDIRAKNSAGKAAKVPLKKNQPSPESVHQATPEEEVKEDKPVQSHARKSLGVPTATKTDTSHEIDALLDLGESQMSTDAIQEIIEMTRNDPDFDMLFNMFHTDKTQFLEKEYGVQPRDQSPREASEHDETGHFSMFSPSNSQHDAVSRMSTPECVSLASHNESGLGPSSTNPPHDNLATEPVTFTDSPPMLKTAKVQSVGNITDGEATNCTKVNSKDGIKKQNSSSPVSSFSSEVPSTGVHLTSTTVQGTIPVSQCQTANVESSGIGPVQSVCPSTVLGQQPILVGSAGQAGVLQNVQILHPGPGGTNGHVETIQIVAPLTNDNQIIGTSVVPNLQGQVLNIPDMGNQTQASCLSTGPNTVPVTVSKSTTAITALKSTENMPSKAQSRCRKNRTNSNLLLSKNGKLPGQNKKESTVPGSNVIVNKSVRTDKKNSRLKKKCSKPKDETWAKNCMVVDPQSGIKRSFEDFKANIGCSSSTNKTVLSVANKSNKVCTKWTKASHGHVAPVVFLDSDKQDNERVCSSESMKNIAQSRSADKLESSPVSFPGIDLTRSESRDSTEWDDDFPSPSTSGEKVVQPGKTSKQNKALKASPAKPRARHPKSNVSNKKTPTKGSRTSSRIQKQKEAHIADSTKQSPSPLPQLSMPTIVTGSPSHEGSPCNMDFPTIDLRDIQDSNSDLEIEIVSTVSEVESKSAGGKQKRQRLKPAPKNLGVPNNKLEEESTEHYQSCKKDMVASAKLTKGLAKKRSSQESTSKSSLASVKDSPKHVPSKSKSLGVAGKKEIQSENDLNKSLGIPSKKTENKSKLPPCPIVASSYKIRTIQARTIQNHSIEKLSCVTNLWHTPILTANNRTFICSEPVVPSCNSRRDSETPVVKYMDASVASAMPNSANMSKRNNEDIQTEGNRTLRTTACRNNNSKGKVLLSDKIVAQSPTVSNLGPPAPSSPFNTSILSPHVRFGSPVPVDSPRSFTLGEGQLGNLTPNRIGDVTSIAQTVVVGGAATPGGSETTTGVIPMESHFSVTPESGTRANCHTPSISLSGNSEPRADCVKRLTMSDTQGNSMMVTSQKSGLCQLGGEQPRNLFESIQRARKCDSTFPTQDTLMPEVTTQDETSLPVSCEKLESTNLGQRSMTASDEEAAKAAEVLVAMANTPVKEAVVPVFRTLAPGVKFDLSGASSRSVSETKDAVDTGSSLGSHVELINNNEPVKTAVVEHLLDNPDSRGYLKTSPLKTPTKQGSNPTSRNVSPIRSPSLKRLLSAVPTPKQSDNSSRYDNKDCRPNKRKRKSDASEGQKVSEHAKSKKYKISSEQMDALSNINLDKFLSKVHADNR